MERRFSRMQNVACVRDEIDLSLNVRPRLHSSGRDRVCKATGAPRMRGIREACTMPSALSRDSGQSLIMIDEIIRKKNKPNEMLMNESKSEREIANGYQFVE